MALLNYTTHVAAAKTVGEIMGILTAHGARAILQEYDDHEAITGLSFQIDVGEQELGFRLPADWRAVLRVMERDRRVPRRLKTHEQARRVAWRILKDWLDRSPNQTSPQFPGSCPILLLLAKSETRTIQGRHARVNSVCQSGSPRKPDFASRINYGQEP